MEECLKNIRKDPSVDITEIIDVVNIKAQLIEVQKRNKTIKEKLEMEVVSVILRQMLVLFESLYLIFYIV